MALTSNCMFRRSDDDDDEGVRKEFDSHVIYKILILATRSFVVRDASDVIGINSTTQNTIINGPWSGPPLLFCKRKDERKGNHKGNRNSTRKSKKTPKTLQEPFEQKCVGS